MKTNELLQSLLSYGFTQQRIADEIGLSQSMVSLLINGKRKSIRHDAGCSLSALYEKTKKQKAASDD